MGDKERGNEQSLSKEEIWRTDDSCMLCEDVCKELASKKAHELKPKHMRKIRLYEFYTKEVPNYQMQKGVASSLYTRYKSRKMKIVGLECIHELQSNGIEHAIWTCSICFVAGGHYEMADAHLTSLAHIKTYIDEFYPEEMQSIEYDADDVCDQYEKFVKISERIFHAKGLQRPEVLKMKLSKVEAKKKFLISHLDESTSLHVNSKDAKKAVMHCKTCNELTPNIASVKYTLERARCSHFESAYHQKCATILGCIEEFTPEEVFDSSFVESYGQKFNWKTINDVYYLNTVCGMRHYLATDEEVFCSLCFCMVDGKEHFSSEAHVINFLSGRNPISAYIMRQLPGTERRKMALELVSSTFLENESTRKLPLRRLPINIKTLLGDDMRVFEDIIPDVIDNCDGSHAIFCPICWGIHQVPENGFLTAEAMQKMWISHVNGQTHYETTSRRMCYSFDDNFFVPYPPSIRQMAVMDRGNWKNVPETDLLIQTQCDVGLEYVVEDMDNDEVVCTLCARVYPRKNPDVINYHIRSVAHLKQYLYLTNRSLVSLILSQKSEKATGDLMLEWLQRMSSQFPTKMKVYSKKKAVEFDEWEAGNYRLIDSSLNSDNDNRDVYDAVVDMIDMVCCDGAELVTIGAREALNVANIKIIKEIKNEEDNSTERAICRCMNCELVLTFDVETWVEDIFVKHMRGTEHYKRMVTLNSNKFDSYGISEENSMYTVKPFEQKDPQKKVTWQWNARTKQHDYVYSVVGLEDIIERRQPNTNADFFCSLCAAIFPRRAAFLDAHVREFKHALYFLHKYRSFSVPDIEVAIKNNIDGGKAIRKMILELLKEVTPSTQYCIRVYDPSGEAEKKSIVVQQRIRDEERMKQLEAARIKAAEIRKERLEERKKMREKEIERIRQENEEREMRQAEERERQRIVDEERERLLKVALANAKKNSDNGNFGSAKEKEAALLMKAHKLKAEVERRLVEKKNLNPPRLVIPQTNAPKTFSINGPHMMNMNAPMSWGIEPNQVVSNGAGFPGISNQFMPAFPNGPTCPPIGHVAPMAGMVPDLPPGIAKRPSLKGRPVDANIYNKNLIADKEGFIKYMRTRGAERIPLIECPTEFSTACCEQDGALGVNFVYEIVCIDDTSLDSYFCTLCDVWASPKEMMKHILSESHMLSYLYQKYSIYHKNVVIEKDKNVRKLILINFCREIQRKEHPPAKIELRMITLLNKATISRLWPSYKTSFYDEPAWKTDGFQEASYGTIPVPEPISKKAVFGSDYEHDKKSRSRSKSPERSRHKRRRSRTRSRSRSRSRGRKRSRSRNRHRRSRSRSFSRSVSRERKRSRSRERSSRRRVESSLSAQTDAFLAKLAPLDRRYKDSGERKSEEMSQQSFTKKLASLRKMTNVGEVKAANVDFDAMERSFERSKPESAFPADNSRIFGNSSKVNNADEMAQRRKILGIILTMQNQEGKKFGQKDVEALYKEMGLDIQGSEKILERIANDFSSQEEKQTKIDLSLFGLSGFNSSRPPPSQYGASTSAYSHANSILLGKAPSNLEENVSEMMAGYNANVERNDEQEEMDIASDEEDSDDEYEAILSVLRQKPQDKSKNSTPKKGEEKKEETCVIPGQRMALARTVLPNGQRILDESQKGVVQQNFSQPPIPGMNSSCSVNLSMPGSSHPIPNMMMQHPIQHHQQQMQPVYEMPPHMYGMMQQPMVQPTQYGMPPASAPMYMQQPTHMMQHQQYGIAPQQPPNLQYSMQAAYNQNMVFRSGNI